MLQDYISLAACTVYTTLQWRNSTALIFFFVRQRLNWSISVSIFLLVHRFLGDNEFFYQFILGLKLHDLQFATQTKIGPFAD